MTEIVLGKDDELAIYKCCDETESEYSGVVLEIRLLYGHDIDIYFPNKASKETREQWIAAVELLLRILKKVEDNG